MEFLAWLENLPVSQWILVDAYAHPALLACHAIGMGLVVGIVLILDLRVLGYARGIQLETFRQLVNVAWGGFALNLASGVLMFMAYATTLIANWTFDLKLVMIAAGGVSLWFLWRAIDEADDRVGAAGGTALFGRQARLLAVVTALFWLGAIVAGRFIAYTLPEGA